MKFIDVSLPKFGDDEPQERPQAKTKPAVSFRQPAVEEYNLDDTRSMMSKKDVEHRDDESVEEKGEKFFMAPDDTSESQRQALQQISFQFAFSVGKIRTSLFRSISPTAEKALADAVLEGFGLTFALRKFDMSVDLFLQNVTLAMAEEGGIAKAPLLSSAETADGSDVKLVQVRYLRVQKESPEYMTKHEGVDQSVDTELSTFKITLAPEPILALYDFIMTTFVSDHGQAVDQAATHNGDAVGIAQDNEPVSETQSSDKLRVRVKLTSAHGE